MKGTKMSIREKLSCYIDVIWGLAAVFALVGIALNRSLGYTIGVSVVIFWVMLQIVTNLMHAIIVLQSSKKDDAKNV